MNPMTLRVTCPCCLLDDIDIDDSLVLLGDDEQNMQCLHCGFASNRAMKSHIDDNPFPQEFKDVCRNLSDRWWAPSVFTTENYMVVPLVEKKVLKFVSPTTSMAYSKLKHWSSLQARKKQLSLKATLE